MERIWGEWVAGEDVEDEAGLAGNIAVDVGGELNGEILLELGIGIAVGIVGAEVVAQNEVVVQRE